MRLDKCKTVKERWENWPLNSIMPFATELRPLLLCIRDLYLSDDSDVTQIQIVQVKKKKDATTS